MKSPRSFTVLGQRFTVNVVDRDSTLHGQHGIGSTDNDLQVVLLKEIGPGGVSAHQQVDTFLHEALHALFYLGGLRVHTRNEENLIAALAPQLLLFLRENPKVVAYLTQEIP